MNVVLEGPDGSGKSTLAAALARQTGMEVIQGNGPPKSDEEFQGRCVRYLGYIGKIFDRHPVISESVYSRFAGRQSKLRQDVVQAFWATKPFIVYVRPINHHLPDDHACKAHETPEHVASVVANHAGICRVYDELMLTKAHYIYRRAKDGTSLAAILKMASEHPIQRGAAWTGFLPELAAIGRGNRWDNAYSRNNGYDSLYASIGPTFVHSFCDKCGYAGASRLYRDENHPEGTLLHQVPDSEELCNYSATPVE